jgi:DNA-directed RNA polymerase sigma subunit (sigma70/sigma32)
MTRQPRTLNDVMRDRSPGPVDAVLAAEHLERLKTGLDALTDAQLQIVTMRFGLAEHRPRSITFVAKIMRMSREEAEAKLADALAQLREHMA